MSEAGPISTITIAFSSFIGVIVGGILSDRWVQKEYQRTMFIQEHRIGIDDSCINAVGVWTQLCSYYWS